MAIEKPHFTWDNDYFEARHGRNQKIQLGLIGLAVGLMLMDLTRWYTLAPLLIILFWVSNDQRIVDKLRSEFEDSSITLSPRSLLLNKPMEESEERIQFRDIETLEQKAKGKHSTMSLKLKEDRELELPGFINGDECFRLLKEGISNADASQ